MAAASPPWKAGSERWIARDAPQWFEEHDRREIAETIHRLRRYLDDIDVSKESALVLMDDIRGRAIARNEQTTYVLTIFAGLFLPLTFVTGLLGINVGGIPGSNHSFAFWIVVRIRPCSTRLMTMLRSSARRCSGLRLSGL